MRGFPKGLRHSGPLRLPRALHISKIIQIPSFWLDDEEASEVRTADEILSIINSQYIAALWSRSLQDAKNGRTFLGLKTVSWSEDLWGSQTSSVIRISLSWLSCLMNDEESLPSEIVTRRELFSVFAQQINRDRRIRQALLFSLTDRVLSYDLKSHRYQITDC